MSMPWSKPSTLSHSIPSKPLAAAIEARLAMIGSSVLSVRMSSQYSLGQSCSSGPLTPAGNEP
jgi:hypothetical protein